MALSTPHSIHTSQCTETLCEVLNTLSSIMHKYLQEQDELYQQFKPLHSQCNLMSDDCNMALRDELYSEIIQIVDALDEIEKVLRIPQLEPYLRNYSDHCR